MPNVGGAAAMNTLQPRLIHEALVYSSDEAFLARCVPFLRDGLAAGAPAIVVVTPSKITLLREALGQDAQRVSFSDAGTLYRRPAQAIAEYRRHLDTELPRANAAPVRVIGEVQFGSTGQEHAAWTRYESVLNSAFAGYPAWFVCPYDTRALPEQVVADAVCTHPFVSSGDQPERSSGYIETDELVGRPLVRETEHSAGPLVRLTATREGDLDHVRRVVAGAARAAGLAPTTVDDVTVAVSELVRDALRHGEGEATVQIIREGARWHCEVTDGDFDQRALGGTIGLSIACLIGERVELASGGGTHTVRLTFAGAADSRQRIVDAASELFYQNGIRATGINTIISHSGVAKATFFHHFPSKNDLVIVWLQQPASRWFDRIRTKLEARTESPHSRLLTFFDLLGEWFARDDFRGCALQNAAVETPEAAHPIRQLAHDSALEIQTYLRRLASDAGLPNPARTAEQLFLLTQGAIATAVATRSPDAAEVARAAAKRILTPPERRLHGGEGAARK